eukprot:Rmarinus@m.20349
MNETQANQSINQMVAFIKQEAQERATEIMVKTEEEFNIKKLSMVEAAKQKLRQDYDKKQKNVDVQKRIQHSTVINKNRLRVLRARDEIMEELKEDTLKSLERLTSDPNRYSKLLHQLIVEGLATLEEKRKVLIRIRQQDQKLVKQVLDGAVNEYKKSAGCPDLDVSVDSQKFLPPGKAQAKGGKSCAGGILLLGAGGKISCSNTLDSRLEIAFEGLLPAIREKLFPDN